MAAISLRDLHASPENLARVMAQGIQQGLEAEVRRLLMERVTPLVDEAAKNLAEGMAARVEAYQELADRTVRIHVQLHPQKTA